MNFREILEKTKGVPIILGLIDLDEVVGEILSISDDDKITIQKKDEEEEIPIDFVKYVTILNPENN